MAEEPKKIIIDDEYQFPETEYLSGEEGASSSEKSAAGAADNVHAKKTGLVARVTELFSAIPVFKNKRVLIAIVVVILFIVILPFLRSSQKTMKAVTATPVAVTATQAPPAAYVDDTSQDTNTRLQSMGSKVRDLESQLADLQSSVAQLKANNQQLAQTVTDLSGQLRDLTNQLGEALAAGVGANAQGPRVVYHLRAVLPDRAWITTNTGETLTVTIGDEIKHYGVVRSIDPNNGVIDTSSGRKITYGPNDF